MLVHTSPSPATAQGARHSLPLPCSKPALGLRQMPALPLLSLVPGVTAGFSPFLTQDWAGRSLQNKSVTTTGHARLEKSWATEMFVFEEGADLPTSFSPTLKTKAVLAASLPRKKKGKKKRKESFHRKIKSFFSSQRAAGVAARQQQAGKCGNLSPEAGNHRNDQYIIYFYRAIPIQQQVCRTVALRTGTQFANKKGSFQHQA